jgi:hypothetical protein
MAVLNAAEKAIRAKLYAAYKVINDRTGLNATGPEVTDVQNNADHAEMEAQGRALHEALVKRGQAPVHGATLVKNRGFQPHERGFYEHLHSVESLLNQTS